MKESTEKNVCCAGCAENKTKRNKILKDPVQLEEMFGKSDVRVIMAKLLHALGMNMSKFSKETGFAYMRVFDLQRGRVARFGEDAVSYTLARFPQVNKNFLYTGEGPVLNVDYVPEEKDEEPKMYSTLLQHIMEKDKRLDEKERELAQKERELMEREIEIIKREAALGIEAKQNVG